ncbi:uncharacterized protein LOC127725587 isoform X2 [Mytilus californianus]|uniref:uncharacterized protein LOC127725587 isoform X2 n=1 Tax=Mytilus californianus TaxID=6549 RepID=UPI002246D6B3|nr:uncharacterized protein LOC127725587 isoform X2 [Mytilus californianus]
MTKDKGLGILLLYDLKSSSVVQLNSKDESLKSIPVREMEIKLKELIHEICEDRFAELGANTFVLIVGIDLEKTDPLEALHFSSQNYIFIGYMQKGMDKSDIILKYFGAVPSDCSKKVAAFKQFIQKSTAESSIASDVGINKECLAFLENTACTVAEWINSLRNQHLPSVEVICSILLKLLQRENILSIQFFKVIEFIKDLSSCSCYISTICKAAILKLLQVYEFPIKENEKHCATFLHVLSANRLEELVNIYFYRYKLLRPLIANPTILLEKSKVTLDAVEYWKNHTIRSIVRNGDLRTCEVAECCKFFDIICLILDCDNFSTNMRTLKQHCKILHRSNIECVFCDIYGLKELLSNFNIGDNFLSNSIAALNGIHHNQKINLSELRRNSNVLLVKYLRTMKHSEYKAVALKVLDTYTLYRNSFPIESETKIPLDAGIKNVCPSEMRRSILEIESVDLLLLTYLDKHIQLQQHDQWNILESVVLQLFLYNNNLCTSAITKYIKSRDIIKIMMDTEINELPYDILTKHTFLPILLILLEIQDKKEEKQRLLQWINSCDAKYQLIINLLVHEQTIEMTNWSTFPQNLSLEEVLTTNSNLKEQNFLRFVEPVERKCHELVIKSCHEHDERICQDIVERSCHKVVERNNILKKTKDIIRKGHQSCLEFLEINTRENLYKSFAKAIHEHICKDKELQYSSECCSNHQHNSTHKLLCPSKKFCVQIDDVLFGFVNKNLFTRHNNCRCHGNLCYDETCNIHLQHRNKPKLFLFEEDAVSNITKHILLKDIQSGNINKHISLVKDGRVTECQLTFTERCYIVLGISHILNQTMLVVLKTIMTKNNCKQETGTRKQTVANLCLLFGLVTCKQIFKISGKGEDNVCIQFSEKFQKSLSIHGNGKLENIMQKDKLMDLFDILQTDKSKCIKSELYNIINHNSIFRNDEITVFPVSKNVMSNEILRVGSLNNFPSENSPSLIKLAKYGFYYEGKGREVTCFSCGVKHEDWSYRSNPLEVHRQISPYCEYLKTFRPSIDIIEGDCRQNATPRMQTTEISHVNGIGADSVRTCTDAHGMTPTLLISSSPMTVAVQSVDSGLFGSSLSHSSNNLVTSNSTSSSSISQRSSHASTDSGFGSSGSLSSNQSSSSSNTSNLTVPQLPPLIEGPEHSIQRVSGPASRDSPVPQNNRKNTPKEKYPEYIPIERRRATYKNWPPNLDFLHPLDLSECGFFYSNFGDCVRCFHCGIGLRNWESDDNPWVEHARWSSKCPYLLQKKGQEFIDSVLTVLGIQTDSEIEMQTANAGTEQTSQVSSGYGTASSNDVRDPICHPAAQYIIRENIFGDNKEKQVKKTMNQLLQLHEWDDVTNDMLVNALFESKDVMENLDTNTNSVNLSESAVSNSSGSKTSNTQSTGTEDKNKEEDSKKSTEENPEKIQKENEELKELYTCKICLDERVGITFVPCGHLVTCKTCSPKIRRCPLCRTFIRGTIKTTI